MTLTSKVKKKDGKNASKISPAMRQAIDRLNACQIRATPTRISVLQLLEKMKPANLSADQILRFAMDKEMEGCSATIYRTLRELVDHDLIFRDRDTNGNATYRIKPANYDENSVTVSFEDGSKNFNFIDDALREHVIQSLRREKLISPKIDITGLRIVLTRS